ncbi:DUF2637 domain-containing protein [Microbispora rosea]|uniref:DUF2637 domain-containing protein n=1 Tax=Microbispora rosea TaxID=58117 RepID=UPI003418C4B5
MDAYIRWTTTVSVSLLAVIAAVVSYWHMHELAVRHREDDWAAALIPLSVLDCSPVVRTCGRERIGLTCQLKPHCVANYHPNNTAVRNLPIHSR